MGIYKQDSGQVILDGKDISNLSIDERAKLGIGFAFQQPVKFKGITVYDLIKLSSGKDINKKDACEILSKVGLGAKAYIDRELRSRRFVQEILFLLFLMNRKLVLIYGALIV